MPTDPPSLTARLDAVRREALSRLDATALVRSALEARPPLLPGNAPVRVLSLGKSAAPMMAGALEVLGARARDALCLAPHGATAPAGARLATGGHPDPDAGSLAAGSAALAWADASRGAPALVLLSGGASALAAAPAEGLSLEDKLRTAALVMASGATIAELNAVRKHLSRLKGGRLALHLAGPATVLVISDVPGNDLSTIGSGPMAPDPTTWDDVARALARPGVAGRVPPAVESLVRARPAAAETPKPGDPRLGAARHLLLAGPADLARAARDAALALGFRAEADPAPLAGDVASVAARLAAWVAREPSGSGPRLLALAGEPTVTVPPTAARPDGGREQHLALLAALAIEGRDAAVLAAGSDGRDGPTEHAGAAVDGGAAARARTLGLDLVEALREARSGPACAALGVALPRHEAATHLADLVLVAAR